MCIAFLAVRSHPRYPLVVLANRDEFLDRPTAPMARWDGPSPLIAGRDLQAGGTWFGLNESGQMALLTNYREPPESTTGAAPSRGALVTGFLRGELGNFETHLSEHGLAYAGFNIIFGDWRRLVHFSNRAGTFTVLGDGLHGLSNALLNTPWPKVTRGKERLRKALENDEPSAEGLFDVLDDSLPAADAQLPSTGVSSEVERRLSSIRIPAENSYGSRSATVLLVRADGLMRVWERPYPISEAGPAPVTVFFELPPREL